MEPYEWKLPATGSRASKRRGLLVKSDLGAIMSMMLRSYHPRPAGPPQIQTAHVWQLDRN